MRPALLLLAFACCVLPATRAGAESAECRRITRQIAHFETVADRAEDRGDEAWERATEDHIARLAARRAEICPEYAEESGLAAMGRLLRSAGKAAAKYLTFGAL
jgi:hypothetical protein